eukprot:1124087-Rhodomonas_salina.1
MAWEASASSSEVQSEDGADSPVETLYQINTTRGNGRSFPMQSTTLAPFPGAALWHRPFHQYPSVCVLAGRAAHTCCESLARKATVIFPRPVPGMGTCRASHRRGQPVAEDARVSVQGLPGRGPDLPANVGQHDAEAALRRHPRLPRRRRALCAHTEPGADAWSSERL